MSCINGPTELFSQPDKSDVVIVIWTRIQRAIDLRPNAMSRALEVLGLGKCRCNDIWPCITYFLSMLHIMKLSNVCSFVHHKPLFSNHQISGLRSATLKSRVTAEYPSSNKQAT